MLVHVLFLAATITTCFLAGWQWERAHDAGGSFQNLGYALQWPLFGAFTIFFWWRVIQMFGFQDPAEYGEPASRTPEDGTVADSPTASARGSDGQRGNRRRRPLVPPPAPPVDSEEDPDLAAYNRYLTELHEADHQLEER